MNYIWLILSFGGLYLLSKYEGKFRNQIGQMSSLYYFLLLIILFIIGIILWDILGLDFGGGGSPYGDPDLYFNE